MRVFAKAEYRNPGGSVKDRPALRMITEAERRGLLTRDRVILDATSGNTGVAYAMIGAAKGYRVHLVMPRNVSAERRALVHAYGAEVTFSDPMEGSDGAIRLCRDVLAADPDRYYMPDQYNNPENWRAHYHGTANEIWEQTRGGGHPLRGRAGDGRNLRRDRAPAPRAQPGGPPVQRPARVPVAWPGGPQAHAERHSSGHL